jgi:hypothetical protein
MCAPQARGAPDPAQNRPATHAAGKPAQPSLTLDAAPAPPPLGGDNAVALLARALHGEIAALSARADAADPVPAARIAFRRVAHDLLFHGAGAGPDAQAMAVAGLRLADCRDEVDRVLGTIPRAAGGDEANPGGTTPAPPDRGDAAEIGAEVSRFAAACAHGLVPLPSAARPEAALAGLLEPLRRVVARVEKRPDPREPRAWPALDELRAEAPPTEAGPDGAGDLRAAIAGAGWLAPAEREACARLAAGLAEAGDERTMRAHAACLAAATDLTRGEGALDETRLRAMVAALAAQPRADTAALLARALEATERARRFDTTRLPPAVRAAAREIQMQARRAAVRLAPLLPRIAGAEDPLAQPDLASALETQTGAAADLERLRAAAGWPERLGSVRAGSREPFEQVVRNWAGALAQPDQRVRTRATMDAFAEQLARFVPVRMETRLRAEDPRALAAAAGRATTLLACLDERRTAWALAWTRGSGGEAAAAMGTAAGVTEALAAIAALRAGGGGGLPDAAPGSTAPAASAPTPDARHGEGAAAQAVLSRWGGFAAPPGGMGIHPRALEARAEVALDALLAGDDARARTQLDAIQRDAPLAWLGALLLERLGGWCEERGGASAQLDAACSGPGADAWLGSARPRLMLLARYAREEAALRGGADRARLEAIRAFLGALARDLARQAGSEPPFPR